MNPVSQLNELRQGLAYIVESRAGSEHEPVFTVTVEVDGENYLGQGRSKKLARMRAAEAALVTLRTKRTLNSLPVEFSYRHDDRSDCLSSSAALDRSKQNPQNAIIVLNELYPTLRYKLKSRTGPDHDPVFIMTVVVDGRQYVGQGRSMKLARAKAAESALNFTQSKRQTIDKEGGTSNGVCCHSTHEPQNAVTVLNEVRPGLVYELKGRIGTDHAPTFTMSVEVDGKTYVGKGGSQKLARVHAAEEALKKLIKSGKAPALSERFSGPIYSLNPQNALSRLNELHQGLVYNFESRTGPDHQPVFTMTVQVNGAKYVGRGKTKMLAKMQAAEAALRGLKGLNKLKEDCSILTDIKLGITKDYELDQPLAKGIFKSVLEQFFKVTANRDYIKYRKYKVLAGIVMTTNLDLKTAKVISVTTGTKFIEGKYLSRDGTALNDSHAEIVARRCLIDFLYTQLELHRSANTAKDSIFVEALKPGPLYKLKEGIQFHLFIDTPPCGDARIFSPDKSAVRIDKHPNRIARGLLRTKIEAGEGAIPVKNGNSIQTLHEVMQGQRLLTMSCSDKIARWNVVGVQGALLSSVIQPIYFYSIVLGSSFHPDHLYRALCGRIETSIQSRLPASYFLNKPKFALVISADTDAQKVMKAPKFGINWTINDRMVEVVDSSTGRTVDNKMSQLTKQQFFARYANLIRQLPNVQIECTNIRDYCGTKLNAHVYQIAKHEFFGALLRQRLGSWIKKPIELDKFGLPHLYDRNISTKGFALKQ